MLRHSIRALLKTPGFTLAAILALALGIGGNTAMFSLVNAVLLRPLPYRSPERLVIVSQTLQSRAANDASAADFQDWRDRARSFEQMAAFSGSAFNLTGGDRPEKLIGMTVTSGFFETLGVAPALGRGFVAGEDQPGANHAVVLSDGLWRRQFGADPKLIGKNIQISQQSYTVIGVMPRGFRFYGPEYELWTPLTLDPDRANRSYHFLLAVARLKTGVTLASARAELDVIARQLTAEYPKTNQALGASVVPLDEELVGSVRPAMLLFMGAVALVLLIACANVANLLLVRAAGRQTEFAIRAALGAGRGDIVRRLLSESMLLAVAGGALGVFLAQLCIRALVALDPGGIPRLDEIGIDVRVLAFTIAVSLVTGILFGLAPASQLSKIDLNETLKEGSRGASLGRRGGRTRAAFVVAEFALALVLLVGAGLLIRSFAAMLETSPGFRTENLLTMNVSVQPEQYASEPLMAADFERALEKIRAIPGVLSAAAGTNVPGNELNQGRAFAIQGRPSKAGQIQGAAYLSVSPAYFRAAGIPLLRGREFTAQDRRGAPDVVIISDAMARRFFPGEDPIGKRIVCASLQFRARTLGAPLPREIVGVVGDVQHVGQGPDRSVEMYAPQMQNVIPFTYLMVRTAADPSRLSQAMVRAVNSVLKDSPVAGVKTIEQRRADSVARPRFHMLVVGAFAGVALLLAAIGIYGVMAYSVAQRTQEIGIRMALGADARRVLALVLGNAIKLAGAGVALGLAGAFAATRLMTSLLYDVKPADPLTFTAVALVIVVISALATLIPAWRAAHTDPARTLR
ncbi:MAG: ABC transporter permease [Acidobacteriia bacterium]|nr:ABC transporter permease [Terriglobia bacterium]